jgi:hypothetical protein
LDAVHFRKRAAEAREMAGFGQDPALVDLLLEVARDMEAEADAMDAGIERNLRASGRVPGVGVPAVVSTVAANSCHHSVSLSDLSLGGAFVTGETSFAPGVSVILRLLSCNLQLAARVTRVEPRGLALAFSSGAETLRDVKYALDFLEGLAECREPGLLRAASCISATSTRHDCA